MVDFTQSLASANVPTTEEAATAQWKTILTEQGSTINNDSDYSPFWRIVSQLITKPLINLINNVLLKVIVPEFYLKTATLGLDDWASNYNVTRKQAEAMTGVVTFHRTSINDAAAIPVGTVLVTSELNGAVLAYQTTTAAIFNSTKLSAQANVQAISPGQQYNLAAGYINGLQTPISGITVSTDSDWIISLGQDLETDEALRDRIRVNHHTLSFYHTDGVYKVIIASFAGVDSCGIWFRHNNSRGPGSADAYLLFDDGIDVAATLTVINAHISAGYHGHGDDLLCIAMPRTSHDITATLWFEQNLLDSDKQRITAEVTTIIETAFRKVIGKDTVTLAAPFSRFSMSQLVQEIHSHVSGLASIEIDQGDIVSDWSVPSLGTLTLTQG